MINSPVERRSMQRDWLGHVLQTLVILVMIFAGIGVPFAYWASGVTEKVATLSIKGDRADHDIIELRQTQTLVTNQLFEVNKGITRIDTQLEGIKDGLRPKR